MGHISFQNQNNIFSTMKMICIYIFKLSIFPPEVMLISVQKVTTLDVTSGRALVQCFY